MWGPARKEPRIRTAILIATLALLATSAVTASTTTELKHSQDVIRFFHNHGWMAANRHSSCQTVPWRRTCQIARGLQTFHRKQVAHYKKILWFTMPNTNDWRTSVTLAQRPYPGTQDWLLFISDREGGWGPFVMNHQGSGAGGWLQFMSSTFYAYVDDARADVARRGFKVPAGIWSWTNPMGQALTGAYMRYTGRDGCHWCL